MGSVLSKEGYTEISPNDDTAGFPGPAARRTQRRRFGQKPTVPPPLLPRALDKFDYLIVFEKAPRAPGIAIDPETGLGVAPDNAAAAMGDDRRVYWSSGPPGAAVAVDLWREACSPACAEAGLAALAAAWQDATRQRALRPGTSVRRGVFLDIARAATVELLSTKQLELKLSSGKGPGGDGSNSERVFCRVRAPLPLLETKAAEVGYRLPFRREVDPGWPFWAAEGEADEERLAANGRLKSRAGALGALAALPSSAVSPHERQLYADEASAAQWSRRITCLERVADRVPCTNGFPAHAPFTPRPSARHLFAEADGFGHQLLLPSTRLALTRLLLADVLDLEALQRAGLAVAVLPLHDASHGARVTREALAAAWPHALGGCGAAARKAETAFLPSVPACSHPSYCRPGDDAGEAGDAGCCGCAGSWADECGAFPFAQPLPAVVEYFGGAVAVHFAFAAHASRSLWVPAAAGVLLELYLAADARHFRGLAVRGGRGWPLLACAAVVVAWAAALAESWRGEEAVCRARWGGVASDDSVHADDQATDAALNPGFRGDAGSDAWFVAALAGCPPTPPNGCRVSPVTLALEPAYPAAKTNVKCALNGLALGAMALALGVEFAALAHVKAWAGRVWPAALLSVAGAHAASAAFAPWCKRAVAWENHRTVSAHEASRVRLTCAFAALNLNGFALVALFGLRPSGDLLRAERCGNCLEDCRVVIVSHVVWNLAAALFVAARGASASDDTNAMDSWGGEEVVVAVHRHAATAEFVVRVRGPLESASGEPGLQAGLELVPPGLLDPRPSNAELFGAALSAATWERPALLRVALKPSLKPTPGSSAAPAGPGRASLVATVLGVAAPVRAHPDDKRTFGAACARAAEGSSSRALEQRRVEAEAELQAGDDALFEEYASVAAAVTRVSLFSLVWGLVPLLTLLEVLVKMRSDAHALCVLKRRPAPSSRVSVGAWQAAVESQAPLAAIANAAVVCVVLPWLDGWGWQGRLAACLTLDRALSVLASLVRAWVPRDPWLRMADGRRERLSEVVQRQRLVMQRHLHPPPAVVGGPARVAMGDALLADLEPPEEHKPKIAWLKRRLETTRGRVESLREELKAATDQEVWNESTCVAESVACPGLSLGRLTLRVKKLTGPLVAAAGAPARGAREPAPRLVAGPAAVAAQHLRAVAWVRDRREHGPGGAPYEGSPGPDPQATSHGTPGPGPSAAFNQELVLAPIKTRHAELVVDLVDARTRQRVGSCCLPLALCGHGPHAVALPADPAGASKLLVAVDFHTSKSAPLKANLFGLLDERRAAEADVLNLTLGRACEGDWDWAGL